MLSLLLFSVLLIILFHLVVYHRYNWPGYIKLVNKIPGPKGVFFFGYGLELSRTPREDVLEKMIELFKVYGPSYKIWLSGMPLVFISDVDDIQTVLSSRGKSKKGYHYKYGKEWLGNGLVTSSSPKWDQMRKIVTPTFHFSILQQYVDIFSKNLRTMMNLIDKGADQESVDLYDIFALYSLCCICETAMGISIDPQTSSGKKFIDCANDTIQIMAERAFEPMYFSDFNFWISSLGRQNRENIQFLHAFTDNVIKKRKEMRRNNKTENFQASDDFSKKKTSFLDLLLDMQESNALSDKDLREEVDTFIAVGYDTTSLTILWAFVELGLHHEIQDKVYEELQTIFGDSDRLPTYEDLMKMSYLKRVIMESLRMNPTAPMFTRIFYEGIQLKNYFIPPNTDVIVLLPGLHRNPEHFPNPNKFDPDRFLPEVAEKRHPFAYIPFSAGQRNCIGQKFGMLEILTVISTVLRKYQVTSLDKREDIKAYAVIALHPIKNPRWKLTRRSMLQK